MIVDNDFFEDSGGQVVAEEEDRVRRLRAVLHYDDALLQPIELVLLLRQLVDAVLLPQNQFLNIRMHMRETCGGQESREDAQDSGHHDLLGLARRRYFQQLVDNHDPHKQDVDPHHEDQVDILSRHG